MLLEIQRVKQSGIWRYYPDCFVTVCLAVTFFKPEWLLLKTALKKYYLNFLRYAFSFLK